jgi:EmrB/QacA subfamily drug resistance transporter
VFAVYFLTQAVTIPIYGRLSDIYGRKRVFVVAAVIFLAGSLLCGFAHNMVALILFRTLQGIGAGGVQPVASTIVGDLYSPAERAKLSGYISATWGIAGASGPVLGAFLIEHFSWAAIFWINVPIIIGCLIVLGLAFHEHTQPRQHRIDYLGAILLTIGIGALISALVMTASLPAPAIAALGVIAVLAIVALVGHERRAAEPMIPLVLFGNRVVVTGAAGNFMLGMLVMGASAFLPTYVQGVLHNSARVSGVVVGVMSVAWMLGSILAGRTMIWTSYRYTAAIGGVLLLVGSAMLIMLDPTRGAMWAAGATAFLGVGFGFSNSSFFVSTQSSVGWELRGSATAANLWSRQVGQAVGTAVFGLVFNVVVFGGNAASSGDEVARIIDPVRRLQFPPAELARLTAAISSALHDIYLLGAVLSLAVLVLAFALPAGLSAARKST